MFTLTSAAAQQIQIAAQTSSAEHMALRLAAKGEKIVEMNQKAFDIGLNAVKNW